MRYLVINGIGNAAPDGAQNTAREDAIIRDFRGKRG